MAPNKPDPVELAKLLNLADEPATTPAEPSAEAELPAEAARPVKVLVTGAHGLIGNLLYQRLAAQPGRYEPYGLVKDLQRSERSAAASSFAVIPKERLRLADVSDFAAAQSALAGMEVVVHLAADPDGMAGWESVLNNNIVGARNIFEAAHQAGVRRVVYGSTNQVVFGYGGDEPYRSLLSKRDSDHSRPEPIDHTKPTRPMNLYSASKVFGEALAHMYAYRFGMSCLCVRIGWVVGDDRLPNYARAGSLWCSQRDIVQLLERCINAPESLRFDVFFGHSDNRYNLVDIQHAREVLGYEPQDRAEDHLV